MITVESELDLRLALVGEARDGAAQRVGHRPPHEQQVDGRGERRAVLDLVLERERDLDRLGARLELHGLAAGHRGVLDLDGLARAHLVGDHALGHPPASARRGLPHELRAPVRPFPFERDDVAEAVDPRLPAVRVVPERLRVGRPPGHGDRRLGAPHQLGAAPRGWRRSRRRCGPAAARARPSAGRAPRGPRRWRGRSGASAARGAPTRRPPAPAPRASAAAGTSCSG